MVNLALMHQEKRSPVRQRVVLVAALLLTLSACSGGGTEEVSEDSTATTLSEVSSQTETTQAEPAGPPDQADTEVTTTAPASGQGAVLIPPYEVAAIGEPLVIVVEPGIYSTVALENLVYDIVENHSPVTAVVVDDPSVVGLLAAETLDPEQQKQLDDHTFLRIESGVEVTFYGPYAGLTGITIGS